MPKRNRHHVTVDIYRIRLPSGAVVRAMKATPLVLAAHGMFSMALMAAAMEAVPDGPGKSKQGSAMSSVDFTCKACLADKLDLSLMSLADRMAVHSWATADGFDGGRLEGPLVIQPEFFEPLVKGPGAVLLHLMCDAYGVRPSEALGLSADKGLSLALDLAITYRGLRRDSEGAEGEVEVSDVFGGTHKVPASWLSARDQQGIRADGTKVVDWDELAKFYGEGGLSCGGIDGGDGMIGPMPGPDGQRDWSKYN